MLQNFVSPEWVERDLNFPWYKVRQTYLCVCDLVWFGFIVWSWRQGRNSAGHCVSGRQRTFLVRDWINDYYHICGHNIHQVRILEEITRNGRQRGAPIHPLPPFFFHWSFRHPLPTVFHLQPWLFHCSGHIRGKPLEEWKPPFILKLLDW